MKKLISLKKIISILFLFLISISGFSRIKPISINEIPTTTQKAELGIFLMNIYDIDMAANSFYADFYLWCKWKGEIDPLKNIEFVNYVEKWGFTKEYIYDTIQILKNGYKYNVMRIEGRFFHPFSLKKFPVDRQFLDIQVENSEFTIDKLIYVPALNESGFRDELDIPGWEIDKLHTKIYTNQYDTNFGLPEITKESYGNLLFELEILRPFSFFMWKLMLPLIVVLISSMGTMMIFPGYIDARISIPIGALLAAVFLQQSYTSNLPDVGYMVMMDKVYVVSYILIVANFVQAIITANKVKNEEEEEYAKVKRFDFKYIIISTVLFVLCNAIIIVTS